MNGQKPSLNRQCKRGIQKRGYVVIPHSSLLYTVGPVILERSEKRDLQQHRFYCIPGPGDYAHPEWGLGLPEWSLIEYGVGCASDGGQTVG